MRNSFYGAAAVTVLLSAGQAFATPITLNNASFEYPILGSGVIGPADAISAWNAAGNAGVININPAGVGGVFSVAAPDGSQVAYMSSGASIYQTTGTAFQTNTAYTLSFETGEDLISPWSGLTVEFYEGNPSNILQTNNISLAPGPAGTFSPESITLDLGSNFFTDDLLGVEFIADGLYGATNYDFIDDVSLSSSGSGPGGGGGPSGVPEPGTLAVFLTALAGWFGIKTSRRGQPDTLSAA